jgi:hypothetical protein
VVSILAPRRRGACPTLPPCPSGHIGKFQSSLPVAGERVRGHGASAAGAAVFQSSLPVAGERVPGHRCSPSAHSGFNPRSPSPGSVSGRACPPCSRLVSILAPRRRGACRRLSSSSTSVMSMFQSSLPVAGERVIRVPPATVSAALCVSILAPRRRGACPPINTLVDPSAILPRLGRAGAEFQSSLPVAGERVRSRLSPCTGSDS